MTEDDAVLYDVSEGIGWITLNRPDALNALNRAVLERLLAVLGEAGEDPSVEALVLTGAGSGAFSAGADIRLLSRAGVLEVRRLAEFGVRVTREIESLGKPVIAAINGAALSGGFSQAPPDLVLELQLPLVDDAGVALRLLSPEGQP